MRLLLAMILLGAPAAAQQAPPHAGGPQPGQTQGQDAGPSPRPQDPRDASPQARNRGSDGSAAGLTAPGATGITPQGMMGSSTAGGPNSETPTGPRGR